MAVTTSASARVCAWVTPGSASRAITQAEIQKVGFFAFIGAPFVFDERISGHRALPVGNRPMHDLDRRPGLGYQVCIPHLTSRRKGLFGSIGISLETATLRPQLEGLTGSRVSTENRPVTWRPTCDLIKLMIRYGQFCPVAQTAEIFGDRWSPLIIR